MSEELGIEELRLSVRDVLADRNGGALAIPGDEGCGPDRALWAEMASLGWLALPVEETSGGLGLGLEHLAVLYEELGRRVASVPVLPTMLAATAIGRHASAGVRARWLPAIAGGTCMAAVALPDPREVPVRLVGDSLDGTIAHVLFADVADLLLLPVVRPDGACALAVIDRNTPGVTVEPRTLVDLTRSMGAVRLEGVAVSAVTLVDLDDSQWAGLLDHAAVGLACDAVGGAEALFERTGDYLRIREQFGRPIGSFQALKHRMADWKVRIEAIRMLARHSAALAGRGAAGTAQAASGAKAYACDVFAAFAGDAVQLHGGIGFTWEHPCHLYLKRAKLNQQLFGNGSLHMDRVARLAFAEA